MFAKVLGPNPEDVAHHVGGVLADEWGGGAEGPGRGREAGGNAVELGCLAHLGVGPRVPPVAGAELLVALEPVAGSLAGARGHAGGLERCHYGIVLAMGGPGGDPGIEVILVFEAAGVGREARIGGPCRFAHGADHRLPLGIVADGDGDPAVVACAGVGVVGGNCGLPGAVAGRHAGAAPAPAVDGGIEDGGAGEDHPCFDLGDVDVLALAGPVAMVEGHHDGDGAVVAGGVVHVRVSPASRGLSGEAGHDCEAAEGLGSGTPRGEVLIAARVAVARNGAVDDAGIDGALSLEVQSPGLEDAAGEVLDDDIADGDEPVQELHSQGVADVQEDAFLVAVEVVEEARVVERRAFAVDGAAETDGVDCLGMFDPDDFGAEVGKDAGGGGPGDDPGEVADADAGERQVGHGAGL